MARLEYISVSETAINGMLTDFKTYASIPDDSQDTYLRKLLRNAVLKVQEYADRAIIECTLRVTLRVPAATGIVKLYMGGGNIASCTDDRGNEVAYDVLTGGRIATFVRDTDVTVQYTTIPSEADSTALLQTVLRYATADYDGAETAELNRIMTEGVL